MLYIIANPVSGKNSGLKAVEEIKRILDEKKITCKVLLSEYPSHSTELGKICASDENCTTVAVIGGDGTFNEFLNGFYPCDKPVAFIPAGTGNDFARVSGMSKSPELAVKYILEGKIQKCDIISTQYGYCLNLLGTGIDVELLLRSIRYRKYFRGALSYYFALIVTLFVFKNRTYTFSIDGAPLRSEVGFLAALGNGKYCGGGLPVSPESDINDGKLDFVIIKKINRLKLPYLFALFLKGKLLTLSCVEHFKCEKLSLKVSPEIALNFDGELKNYDYFDARVIKDAINIIIP